MGCVRTDVVAASEIVLNQSPAGVQIVATIPGTACEGQMTFVKRSSGDTIYIQVKGATPSAKSYYVILTDAQATYSEDGLVIGDIKAIATVATAILSVSISFSSKT